MASRSTFLMRRPALLRQLPSSSMAAGLTSSAPSSVALTAALRHQGTTGEWSSSHAAPSAASSSTSDSPSADASSSASSSQLSWKDRFAHLPLFRKHKMNRNGNDFDSLPDPRVLPKFKFYSRFFYASPFRSTRLEQYYRAEGEQVLSMATTYQHDIHKDVTVTLVPLSHSAHPQFYYQVDLLLCQHDSVLMEGRVPYKQAPFSTLVPPRPLPNQIRPPELAETTQSWEPKDLSAYWQPFSWGVRDSPNYTVIHAADCYDYEKLPMIASLRWNLPFLLGSFAREVHCLSMIPFLVDNGYKKFAVPWGASHMPIMHEMLGQNGFSVVSVSALPVFDESDGDISANYVRQNRQILTKKDMRDDFWLVGLCVTFTAGVLWYTSRIEVNGLDVATGELAEGPMGADGFEKKDQMANMFAKRPGYLEVATEKSKTALSSFAGRV